MPNCQSCLDGRVVIYLLAHAAMESEDSMAGKKSVTTQDNTVYLKSAEGRNEGWTQVRLVLVNNESWNSGGSIFKGCYRTMVGVSY